MMKRQSYWNCGGEESVQASLEGCVRNIVIYDKIATEFTSCGYQ